MLLTRELPRECHCGGWQMFKYWAVWVDLGFVLTLFDVVNLLGVLVCGCAELSCAYAFAAAAVQMMRSAAVQLSDLTACVLVVG